VNNPVFPEAFSIFNPLRSRDWKKQSRSGCEPNQVGARIATRTAKREVKLKQKSHPAGRELLWRANSKEPAHELGEIVKGGGQLESLVEIFPPTQGRSPHSAAVQNMPKLLSICMPRRRNRSLPDLLLTLRRAA